jgi:hypothetical protein
MAAASENRCHQATLVGIWAPGPSGLRDNDEASDEVVEWSEDLVANLRVGPPAARVGVVQPCCIGSVSSLQLDGRSVVDEPLHARPWPLLDAVRAELGGNLEPDLVARWTQ